MRINRTPLLLTAVGGALVMLVQYWLRPLIPHGTAFRWILNLSPNLLTGFCAPFAVLIPGIFTARTAERLFLAAGLLTLGVLLSFELEPWLRRGRAVDLTDVLATFAGLGGGAVLFWRAVRPALHRVSVREPGTLKARG